MKRLPKTFKRLIVGLKEKPPLILALVFAVTAALVLTVISTGIYYSAGFYKLDLSRPGYEKERAQVTGSKDLTQKTYDTTGPINATSLSTFLNEYDTSIKKAAAYSDFRDDSLSDAQLQLPSQ